MNYNNLKQKPILMGYYIKEIKTMKLKELQKEKNCTIKESAEQLNLPMSTYNNYLIGTREPDIKTLIKLADYFHTSIDYLVGRETKILNLNALENRDKRLIESILSMNELQKIKTEAYFNGLLQG